MQVIGTDRAGNPIGVERGLLATTVYRGRRRRWRGALGDLGSVFSVAGDIAAGTSDTSGGGGFDWDTLWTGLNPVLQGVGARISGGNPYPYPQAGQIPVNPYLPGGGYPQPTASASISPMLMIGGLGLAAIMLMKK